MHKLWRIAVLAVVIALAPRASSAAPLDGSAPIVCAGTEVRECEAGGLCVRLLPAHVNLPQMIRIDTRQKTLAGLGDAEKRTATIHSVERRDGRLVMFGGQEGRGWSIVIVEATGNMSASVLDDQFGFMIFGTCGAP